jgi:hypothetical protein
MSKTRRGDAKAMERHFRDARRAICALEARQKLWQDGVSQDAETRLETRVGHRVDPLDCLDDKEIKTAIDVADALEALHNALNRAEGLFSQIEPITAFHLGLVTTSRKPCRRTPG